MCKEGNNLKIAIWTPSYCPWRNFSWSLTFSNLFLGLLRVKSEKIIQKCLHSYTRTNSQKGVTDFLQRADNPIDPLCCRKCFLKAIQRRYIRGDTKSRLQVQTKANIIHHCHSKGKVAKKYLEQMIQRESLPHLLRAVCSAGAIKIGARVSITYY